MDILLSGYSGKIGRKIGCSLANQKYNIINIDLREDISHSQSINLGKNSFFIHMASQNNNLKEEDITQELKLMRDSIKVCLNNNIKNFLFFSTYKVYENNDESEELTDNHDFLKNDPYAMAKFKCEKLLADHSSYFDSITILRMPPVLLKSKSSNLGLLLRLCDYLPILPLLRRGDKNKRSFLSYNNLQNFIFYLIKNKRSELLILNLSDNYPISTNALLKLYLKKNYPNKKFFYIPTIIENLIFHTPMLKNALEALYNSRYFNNSKFKQTFPIFCLDDTASSICKHGIN